MTTVAPPDPKNIQGDVLSGLPKKTETYVFFQIHDVALFKQHLKQLIPLIKTAAQVADDRKTIEDHKKHSPPGGPITLIPLTGVNIAFSNFGLTALGLTNTTLTQDTAFKSGQKADALHLGDKPSVADPTVPDWEDEFKQQIHAVLFIAGDSHQTVNKKLADVFQIFHLGHKDSSITEIKRISGDVRPGKEAGHEHFGFLDGVSNPTLIGFEAGQDPGPAPIKPGFILTGRDGDAVTRNPWEVDGSFLVFRYLFQLVPEFNDFLKQNPVTEPGVNLTPEQGSELLGARIVGRWKSGAPIELAPTKDDPVLAADHSKRNVFTFEPGLQDKCPFSAHIRKTVPRGDLGNADISNRRMIRRGIQFGPELTPEEKARPVTKKDRGLIFVSYQSSIQTAFQFVQTSWANNPGFPPHGTAPNPGLDAIIGEGPDRTISGLFPTDATKTLKPSSFVVPRGGEYFFTPSISALKEQFASA